MTNIYRLIIQGILAVRGQSAMSKFGALIHRFNAMDYKSSLILVARLLQYVVDLESLDGLFVTRLWCIPYFISSIEHSPFRASSIHHFIAKTAPSVHICVK